MPLLCSLVLSVRAPVALAQVGDSNAIRVQSHEVMVPIVVLDKQRLVELRSMSRFIFNQEIRSGDFHAWEQLAVQGLGARDFRVFEDGREQVIQQVREQPQSGPPLLRDNIGYFWDFLGVGGGVWTVPVSAPASASNDNLPALSGYLVGYAPPPALSGSCHRIAVQVTRPFVLVYSRREYCNTQTSAADPLNATKLGKKLASDMASGRKRKIALSLAAFAPLTRATMMPVQIYLGFPSEPLILDGDDCARAVAGKIGLLGVIDTDTGGLALRFSDFASQATDSDYSFAPLVTLLPNPPGTRCVYDQPSHYQTEVSLPPGKYKLRVVLREGARFGRAEIPLTLEKADPSQLAISGIAVVRRFRDAAEISHGGATILPANLEPLLPNKFEVTPAADTRFGPGEPFYFYLQVQRPQQTAGPLLGIEVHLRILDAQTHKLVKQVASLDAAPYAVPGYPIIPIAGGIDIAKLSKGSYELQAQAADSTGETTAWRTASFTIE